MNVLVTGASGFIGTALIERLRAGGHHITAMSRAAHPDEPGVNWIQHDLVRDPVAHLSLPELDVVYHLAGQTSTYVALEDPIGDLETNVVGLLHLLECFRHQMSRPFIVITGTATEVGMPAILPIDESVPDHPMTFYDISKLTAEMYLLQYVREGWARGCCLRLANVFGRPAIGRHMDRRIIDKVFNQALAEHRIKIYGDGEYLRDYIFIDDVISALVTSPEHPIQTNGRRFYIGTGHGITLKEAFLQVGDLAGRIGGRQVEHEHVEPPVGLSPIEFRNAVIDSSAFTAATGWSPRFDFATGLAAAYGTALPDSKHGGRIS